MLAGGCLLNCLVVGLGAGCEAEDGKFHDARVVEFAEVVDKLQRVVVDFDFAAGDWVGGIHVAGFWHAHDDGETFRFALAEVNDGGDGRGVEGCDVDELIAGGDDGAVFGDEVEVAVIGGEDVA